MKRFIALTAISLAAFSGAASAMTQDTGINTAEIERVAPGVDVSALSDGQINQLLSIIHSDDNGIKGRVSAYLNAGNVQFGADDNAPYPFGVTHND